MLSFMRFKLSYFEHVLVLRILIKWLNERSNVKGLGVEIHVKEMESQTVKPHLLNI